MNPLYWFIATLLVPLAVFGWVLRSTIQELANQAKEHAKNYAIAYVKFGALAYISASTAFCQAYAALPAGMQSTMPWAPYFIFFSQPAIAGLGVLVAFLDRSVQRADEAVKTQSAQTPPTT